MRGTLVVSGLLAALAAAYWLQADALPRSRLAGHVGADGFPKMLAVALGLLAIALAVQTLLEARKRQRSGAAAPDTTASEWKAHLRALGLIAIGAAYIIALPYLGYAVSVAIVLASVATYTGLKLSWRTAAFSLGGAAGFYVIVVRILQIPLPSGFWPAPFSSRWD